MRDREVEWNDARAVAAQVQALRALGFRILLAAGASLDPLGDDQRATVMAVMAGSV